MIPKVRPGVAAVQNLEGPRENDLVAERPTSITLPRPRSGQAKPNGDERTFEACRAEADRFRELEHRAVLGEHASAEVAEAMLEGVAYDVPQQHAAQPVTLEIGAHCEADVVFDDPGIDALWSERVSGRRDRGAASSPRCSRVPNRTSAS
jgi:hypothetical protein